jgi:hypothetical protein
MRSKVTVVSFLHSGVIDTAMICTAESLTVQPTLLNIFEFEAVFEKTSTRVSGAQGKLFDEKKTRGRKSRVRVPLKSSFKKPSIQRWEFNFVSSYNFA